MGVLISPVSAEAKIDLAKAGKHSRKKANKKIRQKVQHLERWVQGSCLEEARIRAKTIDVDQLSLLEHRCGLGLRGDGNGSPPRARLSPSRRRRRIAWVLWLHNNI